MSAKANGARAISSMRLPRATARVAARSRRRMGFIWCGWTIESVMAGLVPAISFRQALSANGRDARHKGERSDAVLRTAMAGDDVEIIGAAMPNSEVEVVVVGGGAAGVAAAKRLLK